MFFSKKKKPCLWKGLVAGLAGGIAATIVMDHVQIAIARGTNELDRRKRLAAGESEGSIATKQAEKAKDEVDEANSTGSVARELTHAVTGHILTPDEEKTGGSLVHYSFGTSMGVLYGAAAEYLPEAATGGGAAFGTLLWLGADEMAVPALGLASPPQDVPIASHLNHWALHIAYGTTAELVRRFVRRLL
jgi:putative membrane protein